MTERGGVFYVRFYSYRRRRLQLFPLETSQRQILKRGIARLSCAGSAISTDYQFNTSGSCRGQLESRIQGFKKADSLAKIWV